MAPPADGLYIPADESGFDYVFVFSKDGKIGVHGINTNEPFMGVLTETSSGVYLYDAGTFQVQIAVTTKVTVNAIDYKKAPLPPKPLLGQFAGVYTEATGKIKITVTGYKLVVESSSGTVSRPFLKQKTDVGMETATVNLKDVVMQISADDEGQLHALLTPTSGAPEEYVRTKLLDGSDPPKMGGGEGGGSGGGGVIIGIIIAGLLLYSIKPR